MDAQQKSGRTPWGIIAGAIMIVGVAAYFLGHAPVGRLEDQLDQSRGDAAASADERLDEQSEDETHLDAVRVLMVERLAEIEGRSRVIAARVAAGSYLLGAVQTCEDLLGENEPRCDSIIEALTTPSYPGDPGYIPKPADEDIMSIADEFEPLLNGICTRDAWPYRVATKEFRLVSDACNSYGAMVGRVLAGA